MKLLQIHCSNAVRNVSKDLNGRCCVKPNSLKLKDEWNISEILRIWCAKIISFEVLEEAFRLFPICPSPGRPGRPARNQPGTMKPFGIQGLNQPETRPQSTRIHLELRIRNARFQSCAIATSRSPNVLGCSNTDLRLKMEGKSFIKYIYFEEISE